MYFSNFSLFPGNRTQLSKSFIYHVSREHHCLTFCQGNISNQTDLQFSRQRKTGRIIHISDAKITFDL